MLATYVPLDCVQVGMVGMLRGIGLLKVGSVINMTSYYVVGIPLSVLFGFYFDMGIRGLWMGSLCGLVRHIHSLQLTFQSTSRAAH